MWTLKHRGSVSQWCKVLQFCRSFVWWLCSCWGSECWVVPGSLKGLVAQGGISLPWLLTPGRHWMLVMESCDRVPAWNSLAPQRSDDCCGVLSSQQFAQYPPAFEKGGGRRGTKL